MPFLRGDFLDFVDDFDFLDPADFFDDGITGLVAFANIADISG